MNEAEATQQQKIQDALEDVLRDSGDLEDDHVLTGWIVSYETASLGSSKAFAGHFYGPREMTTWRAMGLTEWTRHTLVPDEE